MTALGARAVLVAAVLLWGATPAQKELAAADALAARARAAPGDGDALERALDAYAEILDRHPKDRRLVPKVRRRRAALLKRAKRPQEALLEEDAILAGPARRYDKSRALLDGALLLKARGDFRAAEKRLRRVQEEYSDIDSTAAKALLVRGACLQVLHREGDAARCYERLVVRYRDAAKPCVEAFDRLALLAIAQGRPRRARHWLGACADRFAKRARRPDRYGAYLGRLLAGMEAPAKLAEAMRAAATKRTGSPPEKGG